MTPSEPWRRSPPSAPKQPAPEHGIRVHKIGSTWWGKRWIEALEDLSGDYANRLSRDRSYARQGRVHDLEIAAGQVRASVTGSPVQPYEVALEIERLEEACWRRAMTAMAAEARFVAELLAGRMPEAIDEAFRVAGGSLLPVEERELETRCSCSDWANPCKHVAALHYVLGEAFEEAELRLPGTPRRTGGRLPSRARRPPSGGRDARRRRSHCRPGCSGG